MGQGGCLGTVFFSEEGLLLSIGILKGLLPLKILALYDTVAIVLFNYLFLTSSQHGNRRRDLGISLSIPTHQNVTQICMLLKQREAHTVAHTHIFTSSHTNETA